MLEPDLVLADEPTTALDATLEVEILDLLRRLQAETECSVIFVTHHLGVVASLCDDVLVMNRGDIREAGEGLRLSLPMRPTTTPRMLLRCDPARIESPTRRLPTMAEKLDTETVIFQGPADRVKETEAPILEVDSLSVTFERSSSLPVWLGGRTQTIQAVNDVSLSVRRGETVALVGESGVGQDNDRAFGSWSGQAGRGVDCRLRRSHRPEERRESTTGPRPNRDDVPGSEPGP